jgi:hypothetical protein
VPEWGAFLGSFLGLLGVFLDHFWDMSHGTGGLCKNKSGFGAPICSKYALVGGHARNRTARAILPLPLITAILGAQHSDALGTTAHRRTVELDVVKLNRGILDGDAALCGGPGAITVYRQHSNITP